jgi:hypothetical protein
MVNLVKPARKDIIWKIRFAKVAIIFILKLALLFVEPVNQLIPALNVWMIS